MQPDEASARERVSGSSNESELRAPSPKDPLRKLNLIGRSLFRSLLTTSSQVASTSGSDNASSRGDNKAAADGQLKQRSRQQKARNKKQNVLESHKSRSQVDLATSGCGQDEDNQVRADCCLPLSNLMVVQQQQQQQAQQKVNEKQVIAGSSTSKKPLSNFICLIRDKNGNCSTSGSGSGSKFQGIKCGSGGWLSGGRRLSTAHTAGTEAEVADKAGFLTLKDHEQNKFTQQQQQIPVQKQPQSSSAQQQQQQQPNSCSNLTGKKLSATEHEPMNLSSSKTQSRSQQQQQQQRSPMKRALSKSSGGSRSAGSGEQKLDRMGKLIALLDEQYVRRTNSQQHQTQSSVINVDSTCDLHQHQHQQTTQPSASCIADSTSDANDPFYLEESWRSFVKLPSLSSATIAAANQSETKVEQDNSSSSGSRKQETDCEQQQQRANLKIQQDAIWELLTTEVFYMKRLKVIIDLFLATLIELQHHSLLNEIDPKLVFSNIVEIYEANHLFWTSYLHPMLMKARSLRQPLDPTRMRNAFVQIRNIFNPYYRYCLDHRSCLGYFKEQNRSNECFKVYVAWCESQKDCERLRLMDLLAKPMQRLTRYSLLLKAIAKKTENQNDLQSLEQMIVHMNRFVLTVDLELRHQEELDWLMRTQQRLVGSMDLQLADVYNDEIDRLIKSHYCRLPDLNKPLFNCPFKCHRQLIYDSQLLQRGLQLGPIRFKDAQVSGSKLEVVVLLFTDYLFICKQIPSGSSSRWHHRSSPQNQVRNQQQGFKPTGSGLFLANRGLSEGVTAQVEQAFAQHRLISYERPRAGSHQSGGGGSAQASLRVHSQTNGVQNVSPRARSLILSSGQTQQMISNQQQAAMGILNLNSGGHLSPARANSQTCVSLGSSPKSSLYQRQQQQQQQTLYATAVCNRKCSAPPSQSPSFHASSSSLIGNAAREFFRRSAESSRSNDNPAQQQAELLNLTSTLEAAACTGSARPQNPVGSTIMHQHQHQQHQQLQSAQVQLDSSSSAATTTRLRLIRSPFPVERLVMHELKGGQGVFFCQLNDSLTITNSFLLYCSSSSSILTSPSQQHQQQQQQQTGQNKVTANNSDPIAVKRSSSDQRSKQHLKLTALNQESSRSDSESQQLSWSRRESETLSAGCSGSNNNNNNNKAAAVQVGPARQLMNLVKQAQARYQLAAAYHDYQLVSFINLVGDDKPQATSSASEPQRSRLSTWSSFKQSRSGSGKKSQLLDPNDQATADRRTSYERLKLDRRSASSEIQEHSASRIQPETRPRPLATPLSKALLEQEQSMLLAHGELDDNYQLELDTTNWQSQHLEPNVCHLQAINNTNPIAGVCGTFTLAGGSCAGSQSSVFVVDELAGNLNQRLLGGNISSSSLHAPCFEQRRSFSSPTSPKRRPSIAVAGQLTGEVTPTLAPGFNTLPEDQQLLSPIRYPPIATASATGTTVIGATGNGRKPTGSGRRHFSRSARIFGTNNGSTQQQPLIIGGELTSDTEAYRSPNLSANDSNKSANSPGTSIASSDSEFSSTRSSSPFIGKSAVNHHQQQQQQQSPLRAITQQQFSPATDHSEIMSTTAEAAASDSTATVSGQRRNSRRNLSSLRRQNVILSASSDQQQQQQQHLEINSQQLNNRRPSDIVLQRERQQLAATNSWLNSAACSRDSSSAATDADRLSSSYLLPSSNRQRQFLARHAHHYLTSSSQATTVDQTNSAVFDSGEQVDPPIAAAAVMGQLNANNQQQGCSTSFELGHLGNDCRYHQHSQKHSLKGSSGHRNSCFCASGADSSSARSASVETRSPISVTLTLPNNNPGTELSNQEHHQDLGTRATSPVYLSIPRSEAAAARRALLSPINSVAATSPMADEGGDIISEWHNQHQLDHSDNSEESFECWNTGDEQALMLNSGDERVPELNIITTTTTTATSSSPPLDCAEHPALNTLSAEALNQNKSGGLEEEAAATLTGWPQVLIRRRSSSNEDFPSTTRLHSLEHQAKQEVQHQHRAGGFRAEQQHSSSVGNSFLSRFIPKLKRRYGSSMSQRNTERWLTKAMVDSKVRGNMSPLSSQRRKIALSETSGSGDEVGPEVDLQDLVVGQRLSQHDCTTGGDGSANDLLAGPQQQASLDCFNLHASNLDEVGQTSCLSTPTCGYLGFHEKLRLHNRRLEEEQSGSGDGCGGRLVNQPTSGPRSLSGDRRWTATTTSGSGSSSGKRRRKSRLVTAFAWHSASDTNGPSESRSFKALNLTRSVTGEIFDSFLRATSLRSVSSNGGGCGGGGGTQGS